MIGIVFAAAIVIIKTPLAKKIKETDKDQPNLGYLVGFPN
jgi:hypothetical protein